MQAARDRQKSYADVRRKPLEFQVGDRVMLKVFSLDFTPWEGGRYIWKTGKLNRVYLTFPVEILEREIKEFKTKCIPSSKVRWKLREVLQFTSGNAKICSGEKVSALITKPAPSKNVAFRDLTLGIWALLTACGDCYISYFCIRHIWSKVVDAQFQYCRYAARTQQFLKAVRYVLDVDDCCAAHHRLLFERCELKLWLGAMMSIADLRPLEYLRDIDSLVSENH
ncbi:hypothetical protein Tco_0677389 [Tanacetum coccineum]|uniref:Reverse transcriptase domain-containing protein n=1 Tax=Tanacetum coccineum TaxID=301880 RepID=A0ABQ4XCR7_9ASTR